MNTALKVGAASALTLVGMAAHASISQPSSGSSDAILFAEVVNAMGTAAVASYAGDTGVSINSLTSAISGSNTYLSGDANLAKLFAADNTGAGDTIQFAVLGGQYQGNATAPNFKTAGVAQFVTTTYENGTTSLNNATTSTLVRYSGIDTDIATVNSNSGGANSIFGTTASSAGVWDEAGNGGELASWDGGSTPNGNVLGTVANLYYLTAGPGGENNSKVTYQLLGTASLSSGGLTLAATGGGGGGGGGPTVPLPAAVWLLGSGLLGLTGVARRKLKV